MKKACFFANEPTQTINLNQKKKTVSTLRIPVFFKKTLEKGIQKHGNLAKYLRYLLRKYRFKFYAKGIPFSENVKTEYQERGIEVFTKTFRPELSDWLELGIWSSALNYSMCKLFVMLLSFEKQTGRTLNEKAFLYVAALITTIFKLRSPRVVRLLFRGRSHLERKITFSDPPD